MQEVAMGWTHRAKKRYEVDLPHARVGAIFPGLTSCRPPCSSVGGHIEQVRKHARHKVDGDGQRPKPVEKLRGRLCQIRDMNGILLEVRISPIRRSEVLGFGGFVPPGWPALGRWLAYLSQSLLGWGPFWNS